MKLEYRLDFSKFWQFLIFPVLKLTSIIIIFTYLSINWFKVESENIVKVVLITWCGVFIIHILPILIMSTYHYLKSKGVIFRYDSTANEYHFSKGGIKHKFTFNDILKVVKTVSPPKYDRRADFGGFGHFFYYGVYLLDGTVLPISCFIINDEKAFKKDVVELKMKMFPIPSIRK